jgi:hypothetical protein
MSWNIITVRWDLSIIFSTSNTLTSLVNIIIYWIPAFEVTDVQLHVQNKDLNREIYNLLADKYPIECIIINQ